MPSLDEASTLQVSGPTISTSNLDPRRELSLPGETHKMSLAEVEADTSYEYSSIPIHEAYGAERAPVLSSSGSKSLELSLRCLGNEKAYDKKRAMNRTGSCTLTPGDELFGYSPAQPPSSSAAHPKSSAFVSLTSDWLPSSDGQPAVPTPPGDSRWSPPKTSAPTARKSRSTVSKHVTLPHLPPKTAKCTQPLPSVKAIIPPSLSSSTTATAPGISLTVPVPSAPTPAAPISRASTPPNRGPALQKSRAGTLLTFTTTENIPRPHTPYSSTARTPISTPLSALDSTALGRSPAEMIPDLQIGDSTLSLPLSPMPTAQHLPMKSNRMPSLAPLTLERPLPVSITSVSSPPFGRSNSSTGFTSYSTHHHSSSFSSLSSDFHPRHPLTPYQHPLQSYTFQPYSTSTSSLNVASACTVSPYSSYSSPPTQTPRNMTMKRLLAKPAPPSPCASLPIGHAGYANGSGGVINGEVQRLLCHPNGDNSVDLKEPDVAVVDVKRRKQREDDGRQPGRETTSSTPLFTAKRQIVVHDHPPKGDADMGQRLSTDTTMVERSYPAVPTLDLGCNGMETINDHEQEKPTKRLYNVLRRKRSNIRTSNPQPTTGLTRSPSRNNSSETSLLSHAIESAIPVRDRDPEQVPRHFGMPCILSRSRSTCLKGPDMGLADQRTLTPAASLVVEYKAREKQKGPNKLEDWAAPPTKRNYHSGEIKRTDRGLRRSASMSLVPSSGFGPGHGSPVMATLATGELTRMVTGAAADEHYIVGRVGRKLEGLDVNEVVFPPRGEPAEDSADQGSTVTLQFSKTRSGGYTGACDGCPKNDSPGIPDPSALVHASRKVLKRTTSLTKRRRGVQSDHGHGGSSLPPVQKSDSPKLQERNEQKNWARMGRGRGRRPLRLSIDKFVDDVDKESLRNGVEKASNKSNGGNKFWRLMRRFSISLPRVKRAKIPSPLPTLPNLLPRSSVAIPWRTATGPPAFPPPASRYQVPGRSTSSRSSSSFTSSGHTQFTSRTDFDIPPVPKHPAASALSLHIVNPSALEMACQVDDRCDDGHQKQHKFYNLCTPDIPSPKTPRESDWVRSSSPDIQLSSLPLPPRRTPKPNPEVVSLSSIYSTDEKPMQSSESPMIPSFSTDYAVNALRPSPPLTRVSSSSLIDGSPKSTSPTTPIPSILLTTPAPRLCHVGNPLEPEPISTRGVVNASIAVNNPMSVLPTNQTQVPFTRRRSLSLTDEDPWPSSSSMLTNDPSRLNTFHRSNLAPVSSVVTRPGTANTFGVSGGLGIMVRPGTSGSAYSARSGASTITERCLPLERRPSSSSSFD